MGGGSVGDPGSLFRPQGVTAYSFDTSKADQIFDRLLQNRRILLKEGQTIPPYEEFRKRKYCKWHHSMSYRMGDCIAWKKHIQKEIGEGRLIFADHENSNTNPSPPWVNMVDVKGKKPVSGSKSLRKETPASNIPWLYVQCKAEMTSKDWDALFLDMPEEVRKWFAFWDLGKGVARHDHPPDQHSSKGSNE